LILLKKNCTFAAYFKISIVMNLYGKIGLVFLGLFLFSSVQAAYLKNVPQQITQPDGIVIHCFATGDEFHNWLHDSAGFTIIKDRETGYYVYATLSGEELIPSQHIVGTVEPLTVGLRPEMNISAQAWTAKRADFEQISPPTPTHKANGKNEGHINNIVFFIRFTDDTIGYTKTFSFMSDMCNDSTSDESNSMYNYYRTVSYGKLYITTHFFPAPDGEIVLSYQDSMPRNYFRPWSSDNPTGYMDNGSARAREQALLKRAVRFLRDSIPSTLDLDFNNDGRVDNVTFVVTGSPDGWSNLLWPHRSWLFSDLEYPGFGDTVMINGKRVFDYNLQIENYSYPGVVVHEMMHTLGAPDLYRYYYGKSVDPVGRWDLMASTDYSKPQGLSAYMKYKYGGWIDDIPEITEPGTYTLYPANGDSPEKTAYIIRPQPFSEEYIVLEYRNTNSNTFEESLSGSGILIYRIYEQFYVQGNASYDGISIFDEVYLFRSGGTDIEKNGNLALAHFGNFGVFKRTSFGPLTNPSPFYHNGAPMENILITDISTVGDSMQFTFGLPKDTVMLDKNEIIFGCEAGLESQIAVKSYTTWKVVGDLPMWMEKVSGKTGTGNGSFTVRTALQNTGTSSRTCLFRVYNQGYDFWETVTITQNGCVGINETEQNTAIKIYPSPTNGKLRVTGYELRISDNRTSDIEIFDIVGKKQESRISEIGQSEIEIDISHLASGLYFLKVDGKAYKIVKQ
jgi:M6 family metalloprotease-like protein